MKVKAAPGVRVPMDGAPRKYITEKEEVVVEETPYYRLRLRDGDLIRTNMASADGAPDDKPAATAPAEEPAAADATPVEQPIAADAAPAVKPATSSATRAPAASSGTASQ